MNTQMRIACKTLFFALALVGSSLHVASAAEFENGKRKALVNEAIRIKFADFKVDRVAVEAAVCNLETMAQAFSGVDEKISLYFVTNANAKAKQQISLDLENVNLFETMLQICESAELVFTAEDYGFVFHPKARRSDYHGASVQNWDGTGGDRLNVVLDGYVKGEADVWHAVVVLKNLTDVPIDYVIETLEPLATLKSS